MAITGDDGKFALRCWSDRRRVGVAASEVASNDLQAMKGKAADLTRAGAHGYIEILAWNVELSDWVRIDEAGA